jgi:predicted cupin superfamily sugar epimerase
MIAQTTDPRRPRGAGPTALLALLLLAPGARAEPAGIPEPADPRARRWAAELGMHLLPRESGYLALIASSGQTTLVGGRPLAVQSQVYYMLTRELPVNYLHWLESDDTHILLDGGPVDYFVFHPDGRAEKLTLGRDIAHGQTLVVPVPGGCWKALRLHPGAGFALMANALSPEWTPDRVRIGAGAAWIARYRGAAPWATEAFLRELIGPNFAPEAGLPATRATP